MTNKHIDEINELLRDHGEALTAFYDEAFRYGKNSIVPIVIMTGIVCSIGGYVANAIRTKIKKK